MTHDGPHEELIESALRDVVPRPEVVAAITLDTAKVVLIAGESGAGKSTLLAEAVAAVREDRHVASTQNVMWSDQLLQLLIRGLADIAGQIAERQRVLGRFAERLSAAVTRLIETKGRDLVVAVAKELANAARSRVSPTAGDAIAEVMQAYQDESAESVGARLDRARVESAREVIVGFVGELVALADDRPLLLVLDRCERLTESSLRLLADLAEVLPSGAQVWAAVRSDEAAGGFLARTDAALVLVPPLGDSEIRLLLEARGLPAAEAQSVLAETDGRALDVKASISLRENDVPTADGAEATLAVYTMRALESLSALARALALRVACLSDPLPPTYMATFALADPDVLRGAMNEVALAGLLTAHGDGLWMHERVASTLLAQATPDERSDAFSDAARAVWGYVSDGAEPSWFDELARLVERAPRLVEEFELLDVVIALDASQLALLASLIELVETTPGHAAVDANALLNYARLAWPTSGDVLSALMELEAAGLVVVVSNDSAAVVVPALRGGFALGVTIGRVVREFGQLPVPSISSTTVGGAIIPRVWPHEGAQYGVGRPSLEVLSQMAMGPRPQPLGVFPWHSRINPPVALLMRATYAGRPVYGAFHFGTTEQRDRALDAIARLDVESLGQRLLVDGVFGYPMTAVPADRFVRAAERVVHRRFALGAHQGEIRVPLDEPTSYVEAARLRILTDGVLRELAGATMREAMQLDLPPSLYWVVDGESYLEVEVQGGRSLARGLDEIPEEAWAHGPYQIVHLARAFELQADERILRWTLSMSKPRFARPTFDPIIAEIGRRRHHAATFNQVQRPLPIAFDDSLIGLLRTSFFQEMSDARVMAARLPFFERTDWEVPPTALYVAIAREGHVPGWVPGTSSTLLWAETLSPSGVDECHAAFADGTAREGGFTGTFIDLDNTALEPLAGFDQSAVVRGGSGVASGGVAHLLGYREEDLDFLAPLRKKLA